jgi:hypothetical protein
MKLGQILGGGALGLLGGAISPLVAGAAGLTTALASKTYRLGGIAALFGAATVLAVTIGSQEKGTQ